MSPCNEYYEGALVRCDACGSIHRAERRQQPQLQASHSAKSPVANISAGALLPASHHVLFSTYHKGIPVTGCEGP
jgi:hypothetical protein